VSEAAVIEAPVTEVVEPVASIPSGSLLGGAGAAPVTPVAGAESAVVIPPGPADTQAIESPYFAKLVSENEDLKQYESTLAHFSKPVTAEEFAKETAKGYSEAVKFKGILAPGAEATEKDIATYRKVNGIPADSAEYKFSSATDTTLETMGIKDPALKSAYAKAAHEANITPAQFEKLAEVHGKVVGELMGKMEAQTGADQSANIKALNEGWGDKAQAFLGDAQKLHDVAFVGANLSESEQKDMDRFIGTTAYTKLLHSLGQRIPKETMIHNGASSVFQSSASKFQSIKEAMATNPKHPVLDHTNPNHDVELNRFIQLEKESRGAY